MQDFEGFGQEERTGAASSLFLTKSLTMLSVYSLSIGGKQAV